ncbi:prolyl aminopeptidase [Rhodococcus fascians]|nr:prolyl aminopeptidase [Rhodococcus fascians]MBY4139910.1 prolyl aminopeptidase [Rhodococcus fascians]MBY4218460.1 prolyl aminopeptidase [Rhodococcus fascians]MBY4222202.1 prolyl aminopeptidase [Rhodococcus fascians]MBY4234472.1 prolyl aminopeptidase [Rhodococcus fascians]
MRTLYPGIEPVETGHLDVGEAQRIYWEISGNPDGEPVVFVHGGPGGATNPLQRRYFDPQVYRIVLFDQRGCGLSTPHIADGADLSVNTTDRLISDMEKLREHLNIDTWLVFGGSWGSTLSLAYAQTHRERVRGLVLRGIFLVRPSEIDWYYRGGAGHIFPDLWEEFLAPIPEGERDGDLVEAYHRQLMSEDDAAATRAAVAWSSWEAATSYLLPKPDAVQHNSDARFARAFAGIENHYFRNGCFLEENQLLRDAHLLDGIPGVIVQGRYDVVCPATSAWALHKAWPSADLVIVDDAGHSAAEPGIVHHLVEATDRFRP